MSDVQFAFKFAENLRQTFSQSSLPYLFGKLVRGQVRPANLFAFKFAVKSSFPPPYIVELDNFVFNK